MEGVYQREHAHCREIRGRHRQVPPVSGRAAGEFEKWGASGQAAGAVHHRFGVGDGFAVVIDEWESVEQFQQFFSNPELQAFIGEIGASPGPPEMIVAEAVPSPDEF
jgi:hypothetical protein